MPTIVQMTGFESGSSLGLRNGPAGQTPFDFDQGTEGSTIVVQSANTRNGQGYAGRFVITTSAAADAYWTASGGSPGNSLPVSSILVGRFWWCCENLTGASSTDVPAFAHINSSAGGNSYFEFHESTNQLSLVLGSGTMQYSPVNTVVVGQWYAIDFRINMSGSTWTGDWKINGVAQTQATQSAAADHITEFRIGCTSLFNIQMAYDDIMLSQTSADYPLPDAHIIALPVNGSGTNVDPANFEQTTNNGSSFSAISSPASLISELPPSVGSGVGAVVQNTVDANGYLEFTHSSMPAAPVYAVKHVISGYASSGTANNLAVVLRDGTSDGHTLGTPTVPVSPSWSWPNTTNYWANQVYAAPPSGGSWTATLVNALRTRMGFSTNTAAQPGINAAYLEVMMGKPAGWNQVATLARKSLTNAASMGLISWSGDPTLMNTSYTSPGTGKCLAVRCYIDNPVTINNFYCYTLASGSGLSNCYIGLYNAAGTLLGHTNDISSLLDGAAGLITAPVASAISGLTFNQEVRLVFLFGAGTTPTLLASRSYGANIGLTSDLRWESGGSGLTSLPSTLPTMAAAGAEPPFVAVGP